jgi:hypothetical protein
MRTFRPNGEVTVERNTKVSAWDIYAALLVNVKSERRRL